jgi:hypothetical protein
VVAFTGSAVAFTVAVAFTAEAAATADLIAGRRPLDFDPLAMLSKILRRPAMKVVKRECISKKFQS